jgi:hypothetical protein
MKNRHLVLGSCIIGVSLLACNGVPDTEDVPQTGMTTDVVISVHEAVISNDAGFSSKDSGSYSEEGGSHNETGSESTTPDKPPGSESSSVSDSTMCQHGKMPIPVTSASVTTPTSPNYPSSASSSSEGMGSFVR